MATKTAVQVAYETAWRKRRIYERLISEHPNQYAEYTDIIYPSGSFDTYNTYGAYWGREWYGDEGKYEWLNSEAYHKYCNLLWWYSELEGQSRYAMFQLKIQNAYREP